MTQSFIDIHCHPQMKPYGKSFDSTPVGENNSDKDGKNSIWHYDPPTLLDRGIQGLTGITKFRESDFATLAYGSVRVVCASLYPIEKGFFNNELGQAALSDLANQFITSVGRNRVNYIQGISNYFEDVCCEYNYYKQLNNQNTQLDSNSYKYVLVKNYSEIENYTSHNPNDSNVIFVVITIEGLHVLNSDTNKEPDEVSFLNNLKAIKGWDHPPFFVTFAHHFYNHLCGHAKSLSGIVANTCDQRDHINTGFAPLGERILHAALDSTNGKRIHIDVKHMSALSRARYFEILAADYSSEKIPVIVSHGACNGLRSMTEPVVDGKNTAYKLLAEDINFYDNEILMVAQTGGIFGFQLDERRIASDTTLKNTKHSVLMNKIRHYRAELLWNQIQHILELLDRHDLFAWDCMAIGSDYDGIINPLNGYLTAETFEDLQQYLERYVFNYMNDNGKMLKEYNQLAPAEIVNRIFYDNAFAFMKKWFA